MKTAVVPIKNDNFGGRLFERAFLSLSNNTETFDNIILVDWKVREPRGSFWDNLILMYPDLWNIAQKNNCNIFNVPVYPSWIEKYACYYRNYAIVESWARNLGIIFALNLDKDPENWICSTNIDVLIEPFTTENLNTLGLYTSRRFNVDLPLEDLLFLLNPLEYIKHKKDSFRQAPIASNLKESFWDPGDLWSLTVSCGDFQLATNRSWVILEGFEEGAAGRSYADSNLMKKAHLHALETKIVDIFVAHLNHGYDVIRTPEEILPLNDQKYWIQDFSLPSKNDFWTEALTNPSVLPEIIKVT